MEGTRTIYVYVFPFCLESAFMIHNMYEHVYTKTLVRPNWLEGMWYIYTRGAWGWRLCGDVLRGVYQLQPPQTTIIVSARAGLSIITIAAS